MLNNNEDRYYLIEKKIDDLIDYLDIYTLKFPKYHKYVLGERIRNQAQDLLDITITINKKHFKKTDLSLLDVRHEQLRVNVKSAYRRKFVNERQYHHSALLIDEIGKMIGAWIKYIDSNTSGKN